MENPAKRLKVNQPTNSFRNGIYNRVKLSSLSILQYKFVTQYFLE